MSHEIDWSALHACYGPATEVPRWLRELVGSPSDERSEAIAELWGNLCHQGTVYEASAAAVPFLFEAAKSSELSPADRNQLLALVVHIGLGEDTTWQGYTSWSVVEDCARAAAGVLPDLAAWALEGSPEAGRWALALAAHHPHAWAALDIDAARLMASANPAIIELVHRAVSGTVPSDSLIDEVLEAEPDLRDYYEQVIAESPKERRARQIVLELAVNERL